MLWILVIVLIAALGGCTLAFFAFWKVEKDTERKVEKLIKRKQ